MNGFNWLSMVGGLAFFFFGLSSARQGLQLTAGEKLRMLLGKLTNNRFSALGLGALLTVILQSSSATTVILVSFAETQLITLTQAFGVILGADIGTTFVVILLTFKKITQYSLLLIAIGIAMERFARAPKARYIGSIVLGFGMIFFGMSLMSGAAEPLRNSQTAVTIFQFLADHPLLNLAFATIFTGIVQASAATIALAMALSYSGVLTFEACVPIVLGANIGTCVTAALSCFGMGIRGRQVAITHMLVKILGVAIVFPFISQVTGWVDDIDNFLAGQAVFLSLATAGKIALTHLLFNIFLAAFFLPLSAPVTWLVQKIFPYKLDEDEMMKAKYIDEAALGTPALAFAQAKSEMMRIAHLALGMFNLSLRIFKTDVDFDALVENMENEDDKIDSLEKKVRFYISKISQESLTECQTKTQVSLLTIGDELEAIGDTVSKDIVRLARKKRKKFVMFSEDGWGEFEELHRMIFENFNLTISMMYHPHEDIRRKIVRHERRLNELEHEMRQSHLQRLNEMLPETYETSTIHLELLGQFRLINTRLAKITEAAGRIK